MYIILRKKIESKANPYNKDVIYSKTTISVLLFFWSKNQLVLAYRLYAVLFRMPHSTDAKLSFVNNFLFIKMLIRVKHSDAFLIRIICGSTKSSRAYVFLITAEII